MYRMSCPNNNNIKFNKYYQDFCIALRHILENEEAEKKTRECRVLLRQMKLEAQSHEDAIKEDLLERMELYKSQLTAVKEKSDRENIVGGALTTSPNSNRQLPPDEQHSRLDQSEQSMEYQNEALERARKTLAETETIAESTLDELHTQKEVLQSTESKVGKLSSLTGSANDILTNMSKPWWRRRAPRDKSES